MNIIKLPFLQNFKRFLKENEKSKATRQYNNNIMLLKEYEGVVAELKKQININILLNSNEKN